MERPDQDRFLRITTEEILRRWPELEPSLRNYLERLGWTLYEGRIVQVEVLDVSDPRAAHSGYAPDHRAFAARSRHWSAQI